MSEIIPVSSTLPIEDIEAYKNNNNEPIVYSQILIEAYPDFNEIIQQDMNNEITETRETREKIKLSKNEVIFYGCLYRIIVFLILFGIYFAPIYFIISYLFEKK